MHRQSLGTDLARGAVAGAVGWFVMDHVLRAIYDRHTPEVRAREDAARCGVPALERVAQAVARPFAGTLSARQRQAGGTMLQWATGIAGGALYGALRGRLPGVAAGHGLAYGAAFSLVVDEGVVPLLGFAPGPRAFPTATHVRGFVGHLVFGVVAEAVLRGIARNCGLQGTGYRVQPATASAPRLP